MVIDKYLPRFDVTQVVELDVDAPPALTYAAIRDTDLRDPVVDALFAIRELPTRIARWWKGQRTRSPRGPVTFGTMIDAGPGFTLLDEQPDAEMVVGSVGRFWRKDYGGRPIPAREFASFNEAGYAKLAMEFSVQPSSTGGSVLRYEARTGTTDVRARRTFGRYWMVIRFGVAMVMRRALVRIRREAERRARLGARLAQAGA